ncbi:MAG: hypothetical protein QOK15_3601 [Nocardioidaceae bacterium]|nr:hypothetical protein [Nocardioidaceae bacterium]
MRRYDEEIDVRRGLVAGQEAPAQFLWRHRLWVVRDIISHWVETGAWWEHAGVSALFGAAGATGGDDDAALSAGAARCADLLGERDVWRVEAIRGQQGAGVFDLAFDWSLGRWHLVGCVD